MFITRVNNMSKNFMTTESDEALLYPVLSAAKLLQQAGHQKLLDDIKNNVALAEVRYEILYEPLINSFVEYVQVFNDVGKLSDEQLMNIGLERAYHISSQYISENGKDVDPAFIYALFSLGLMLDVGRIEAGRKIMICNKRGIFLKEWQPLLGETLFETANFYKTRESINYSIKMCNLMTPLIAQTIVPELGLLCLREDPNMLASWLAILAHDEKTDDDLSSVFQIYNKNFNEKRKKRLRGVLVDAELIESLMAGEAFWKWLKEGLKNKTIEINKSGGHVHKVDGGLFVDYQELAKKFSSIYSDKFPSWTVAVRQFNSLGIAKLSGGDYKYDQFFGDKGKYNIGGMFGAQKSSSLSKMPNGILIEESRGLVESNKYNNSNHLKAIGAPNFDKNLQERAGSVFGVGSKNDPNCDLPK
jgi:hypothetical protein